jgi:hypothetical protein
METPVLLMIVGIILAAFVNVAVGILAVVVGLGLLLWPSVQAAGPRRRL